MPHYDHPMIVLGKAATEVGMPTKDELAKLPIEDVGSRFPKWDASKTEFPTLIRKTGDD